MALRGRIKRAPQATPRSFKVNGKPCQEFDCTVDARAGEFPGDDQLIGVTWNLPPETTLADALKARDITWQDKDRGLVNVPIAYMPVDAQQYAKGGQIAAVVLLDGAENEGIVHVITGPPDHLTGPVVEQMQSAGELMREIVGM